MLSNNLIRIINLKSTYDIKLILTRKMYAKTAILLDCKCNSIRDVLVKASEGRFINKTYDWILWDKNNVCLEVLHQNDIQYLGPNAQITHVESNNYSYILRDIHSKGKHLGAPLEFVTLARAHISESSDMSYTHIDIINDVEQVHGINYRDKFNGLTLRGASVIDLDNITSNDQIMDILSRPAKDVGVSAFSKYHFALLEIIRERLNFNVNYRNARGWAGRIENSTFRLGYIGIMQRNEADIGASASYNRINRFAEFDIIQQSWKFETSFLFRFTHYLNMHNKRGNFLAPFKIQVWILTASTIITLSIIWTLIEYSEYLMRAAFMNQENFRGYFCCIALNLIGALCQQGLDPVPKKCSSRIIMITSFIFALVMYNYYTSSLVGGLLSNTEQGPSTVDEIISSELRLSFEDIGYYKIFFRETKSEQIVRLLKKKVLPFRDPKDLPVYTHIEDAIPYLKLGRYAFHCEVVDAYPEIAKHFDAEEICDLRVVSGLLVTELLNSVVHKNSQYTELFRLFEINPPSSIPQNKATTSKTIEDPMSHIPKHDVTLFGACSDLTDLNLPNEMIRSRESGLVKRLLHQRQPKKPECQSLYTVYPVNVFGTADAFIFLSVGFFVSLLVLAVEILYKQLQLKSRKFA